MIYLQGLVEKLDLKIDLQTHFRSLRPTGSIFNIHSATPLELLKKRVHDHHGEEIAAAYNLGRYTVWLSHLSTFLEGDEEKKKLLSLYEREAPIINQEIEKLDRITKRDLISEFKVPNKFPDAKPVKGQLGGIMLSMDVILNQKKGAYILTYRFGCPLSQAPIM